MHFPHCHVLSDPYYLLESHVAGAECPWPHLCWEGAVLGRTGHCARNRTPSIQVAPGLSTPMSPSQGILLVYDITNRWSFDGIDRWIKEIDEVGVHHRSPFRVTLSRCMPSHAQQEALEVRFAAPPMAPALCPHSPR